MRGNGLGRQMLGNGRGMFLDFLLFVFCIETFYLFFFIFLTTAKIVCEFCFLFVWLGGGGYILHTWNLPACVSASQPCSK